MSFHGVALGIWWGLATFALCEALTERERPVWGWWLCLAWMASLSTWLWSWWFILATVLFLVLAARSGGVARRRRVRR